MEFNVIKLNFNEEYMSSIDSLLNEFDSLTILISDETCLTQPLIDFIYVHQEKIKIIKGVICRLTTEEVDDIVLDFNSKFRECYKDDFNTKYFELGSYLDLMDKERNGYFSRHLIKNKEMRDILDFTFKLSTNRFAEFANKINGQNILIIADNTGKVQSIKNVCSIIEECYAPKRIMLTI